MLGDKQARAVVAVSDLARTKQWYTEKLGLTIDMESEAGVLFNAGNSKILAYPKPGAHGSDHTELAFNVEDVQKEMDDLKSRGVVFEEYDMPGLKTVNGIATMGDVRSAWFKDPDGNILAIGDMKKAA